MQNDGVFSLRGSRSVHISSKHKLFDLKLDELLRYRGLIWLFTSRGFKVSYKQTILGPLWLFISPLMTSIVHTILFGNIAGLSTDGVPQLLFYLAGNSIWGYFSGCLTSNAAVFSGNAGLFGKVYFPRLVMPVANIFSAAIQLGIRFLLILPILLYYAIFGYVAPQWWAVLVIPLVLLQLGIMGMGIGIIISSMTTKYRDLGVLVGFGMSLWMYATPVVYPLSAVSEPWLRNVLLCNPVTASVEMFRCALFGTGTLMPVQFAVAALFTVTVALAGIVIFNRIERTFMDTV